MAVHDIASGKKLEGGEEQAFLFYKRLNGQVSFRMAEFTLEDACYLERILAGVKSKILDAFSGEGGDDGGPVEDNHNPDTR